MLMGKFTIFMVIFNRFLYVYHVGYHPHEKLLSPELDQNSARLSVVFGGQLDRLRGRGHGHGGAFSLPE